MGPYSQLNFNQHYLLYNIKQLLEALAESMVFFMVILKFNN